MASIPAAVRSSSSLLVSSWGGLSSVLRIAASEQRGTSGQSSLLKRITRAMRAAGPDRHSSPLHGLMCNVDCTRGND